MSEIVITRAHLSRLRSTYRTLDRLIGEVRGDDPAMARRLKAEQDALTATSYAVTLPCMLCEVVLTGSVRLDETSMPYKCICGVCSDRIDAEVLKAQPVAP